MSTVITRLNQNVITSADDRETAINELLELYGFEVEETTEDIVTFEGEEMLVSRKEEILEARAEQAKQNRIAEIKKQLDAIDLKSIRALRDNDTDYIAQYKAQADTLRSELQELIGE